MTEVTKEDLQRMGIAIPAHVFQARLNSPNTSWLFETFIFEQTPQGHDHWSDRQWRGVALTNADREWLSEVVEALKRREAARPALKVADDLIEAFVGVGRASTAEEARLAIVEATPRDRLDVYCRWNGILGYSSRLADIMEGKIN